ncbi:MAG: hypothetical protein WBC95_09500 [Albidovulum sp.]
MKNVRLKVVSDRGIEALIECDGSQAGAEDYYAVVTVNGFIEGKRIFGVDPVQAFSLGLKLIEQLTEERRLADGDGETIQGANWRIEFSE